MSKGGALAALFRACKLRAPNSKTLYIAIFCCCRLQPTEAMHGSGSWFMWNALNGDCWWLGSSAAGMQCTQPWLDRDVNGWMLTFFAGTPLAGAVAVPSALTLSAEHRKHFLSTLVMLITGQSVRAGTTDPSILHLILTMLRKWLLDSGSAHLTAKELLVIIQRIAQVRALRLHALGCGCSGTSVLAV